MNEPILDKSLIGLISGYVIGILVSLGYIAPVNQTAAEQNTQQLVGGIILVVSLIGWFLHHIVVSHAKAKNAQAIDTTKIEATTTSSVPMQ